MCPHFFIYTLFSHSHMRLLRVHYFCCFCFAKIRLYFSNTKNRRTEVCKKPLRKENFEVKRNKLGETGGLTPSSH